MNKKQLIAQLSGSLNLSKADAERTFDTITNTILDALKGDDSVKIAGFGTYKVAKRKARVGRNPRTGEKRSSRSWIIPSRCASLSNPLRYRVIGLMSGSSLDGVDIAC